MRILVVSQMFWPENFRINDVVLGLHERGHDVSVLTGLPNYPEGSFYSGYSFFKGPFVEKFNEIEVFRVPLISRGKNKGLRLVLNFLSFMIFSCIFGPLRIRKKFDYIFVYGVSPVFVAIPGIVFKFLTGAKLFFWVNDLWPETLQATGIIRNQFLLLPVKYFVKVIYFFCDKILITSKGFEQKIISMGVLKNKIVYWPQWVEPLFLNIIKQKRPSDFPDGTVILFAGNIGTSQGVETILNAALQTKEYESLKWVFIGDGLKRDWLLKKVQELHLDKTVFWLGKKDLNEMPSYYSHADILLVSLRAEPLFKLTLPGKVQSCLASSKPILGSINGEGADVILESNAGVVAPADSASELASKAIYLLNFSDEQRSVLGSNGAKYSKEFFDREKLLCQLEELMR